MKPDYLSKVNQTKGKTDGAVEGYTRPFSPVSLFRLHRKGDWGATPSPAVTPPAPLSLRPPSGCGRYMRAPGPRPVFFLGFMLAFSIFLGLGLGLLSAFGVVEVEAGRAEVRRDGEGEVEPRLTLLKAPMLLSLLRRPDLCARYVWFKGEAVVLLSVVSRLPSPDRVGWHARKPSSSMVKFSVTVADSPRR
jgi:hypothetical protein